MQAEIPADWTAERLGDLASIRKGRIVETIDSPEEGALPYIGAAQAEEEATRWTVDSKAIICEPSDTLVLWDGERSGLAWGGQHGAVSSTVARVRPVSDRVVPEYLTVVLESSFRWIQARRTGSGIPHVPSDLDQILRIPLPPLPEQEKIAAVLASVDEAIRATEAVIEQTRRVKEGLLQNLLTRGIGHTRFKKSAIGEIPSHWSISTPGDLATFSSGYGFRPSDRAGQGLPIIRIQNLNGNTNFNRYGGEPKEKWLVHPGELLFAWAGSAGTSFGPCLWPGPLGVLNQHIYRLTPRRGVDKAWLFETMSLITKRIERQAHGFKTTLLHVHKSDITDQPVPVPPPEEQRALASIVREFDDAVASGESEVASLMETKSGLHQDLLTGAVRVSP
ncbi:MAG: restriction endonuclease subunit S [Bacteroidota bacterium]